MIKFCKYLFQSFFVYSFFIIGRIIGLNLSRKFFSYFFSKIAPFLKSRKIIEDNIHNFSKNISTENKEKIISNMWENYGMTFIEYIFLNSFRNNNSHIDIEGKENLIEIINNNKPAVFISGHFANYELMSMEITKMNIKLATIYRPLNNYFLNPFMEYLRRKYVCKNQIKKGVSGVREAIEYLKKGYSIALMIDQRVSEGEKINFFGKSALTTTLPAQLALKFNLSIIPVFIERDQNDNFKIKFYQEINPKSFNNKSNLTDKLNKVIEEMIICRPEGWIWTHNRWK